MTDQMKERKPACPHGYLFPGNCNRCNPPKPYVPLNGQRTR